MRFPAIPGLSGPHLTDVALRLAQIVTSLRAMVAARGGRDRAMVPLVVLVWGRLGRLSARFEALVASLVAGRTARPARPPTPRAPRTTPRGPSGPRLPQSPAWLVRKMRETIPIGSQIQALLADPIMAALLAAAPRAARILRPLCRMLAVDLPTPTPPTPTPKPPRSWPPSRTPLPRTLYTPDPAPPRKPPWVAGAGTIEA